MLLSRPQLLCLLLYPLFLILMLSSPNFVSSWLFIEFSALVFICYLLSSVINSTYSSVVVYFLIQALSSIGLLFSYFISSIAFMWGVTSIFIVFLLLNLGFFPFNFWYFFSVQNLPSVGIYLSLTGQKLPPVFLFSFYSSISYSSFVLITTSFLFTLFFSSSMAPTSLTLNSLLITSSLFNSSWLLLSSILDFSLFVLYFVLYSCLLFLLMFSSSFDVSVLYTLIGLPPFPLFFLNVAVLFLALQYVPFFYFTPIFVFLALLSNVLVLVLYFNYFSDRSAHAHSSSFYL